MWSRFFDVPDFIRGPKSVVPVDDLTSSSSLNPPATTIYLSTCACEHNSSDKKCARSALLSANDRKFDEFLFRGTSRHPIRGFTAPRSGRILDCFVPVPVDHNIDYVIFRACCQHCLHLSIGHISKDHSRISLSKSYYKGLSADDEER